MKTVSISIILSYFTFNVVFGQPLFRLNHSLWPQILTDNNQHMFSVSCGNDIDISNLFSDVFFDSYEWKMGNNISGTQYKAPQPDYLSGRYDITLKVKKDQKFRVINTIKVTQTNSTWIDCGFEITPDLYLEMYDSLNNLVIRTNPTYSTNTPVTWNIDGILAMKKFSIKVKEADTDIICTDDNLGSVIVPANYEGGILENAAEGLKIEVTTAEVNEATFTSTVIVSIVVQSLTVCKDSMFILGVKDEYKSYLWSDGSTESTVMSPTSGTFKVTVSDFNNCSGQTTFTLNQPPKKDPIIVCENNMLKCTNFTSFIRWLDGEKKVVSNANTYTPSKEGIYFAESWNNPCTALSNGIHWPSCELVNVSYHQMVPSYLFPNPATDYFQFSDDNNFGEYKIYNIYGQLSKSGRLDHNTVEISNICNGIYFVFTLKNGKIVNRYKLHVNK